MNVIDKAIGVINPAAEIKRTIARQKLKIMNTGYSNHGASRTKKSFLGWNFKGGDVTQDIYRYGLLVILINAKLLKSFFYLFLDTDSW